MAALSLWISSDGQQTEILGDLAQQDEGQNAGGDPAHHDHIHVLAAHDMAVLFCFVDDGFGADEVANHQAGEECGDGHQDGVGKEIEEIKESHACGSDVSQRSVTQAGQGADSDHEQGDGDGAADTGDVELHPRTVGNAEF